MSDKNNKEAEEEKKIREMEGEAGSIKSQMSNLKHNQDASKTGKNEKAPQAPAGPNAAPNAPAPADPAAVQAPAISQNVSTKTKAYQLLNDMGLRTGLNDDLGTTLKTIKNKITELKMEAGDDWVTNAQVDEYTKRFTEIQREYNKSQASIEIYNQSANIASTYAQAFMHMKK